MSEQNTVCILVVDDEEIVLSLMRRLFERQGYTVLTASSGGEAIELFRKHCHTVTGVILDLSMPLMGGQETFDALNEIRAGVPVILTSGFSEEESREQFGGRDVSGFLQKPFRPQDVLVRVRKLLELTSD